MMSNKISWWREYATAISATLITAAAGTTVGWTSPTIPILLNSSSHIYITPDESSWIASMMILSSIASPLIAAILSDSIGRKPTLLLAGIPYLIGWILIINADTIVWIYLSRIISGIGYGIVYTTAPMYLGEIASDKSRGSMATLITVMSKVGILSQYCIGPYVSMKTLACVNLIFPMMFLVSFVWVAESPYFYLKCQKPHLAENSLRKLRGHDNIYHELESMQNLVSDNTKHKAKWRDVVIVDGNRRALLIIMGIYVTQQFCGSTAIIAYAQQIFKHSDGILGEAEASIIFGSAQLLTSLISSLLVDRLGRRPLLLASSMGVCLSNLVIGSYFLFKAFNYDTNSINWLPIIVVTVFICSYNIGLSTVPFAITAEMFPTNIKSFATCIIQTFVALITFSVTKMYQVVADNLGIYCSFFGFAIFSCIGFVFIYIYLPETKGQSFNVIQENLNLKLLNNSNRDNESSK